MRLVVGEGHRVQQNTLQPTYRSQVQCMLNALGILQGRKEINLLSFRALE